MQETVSDEARGNQWGPNIGPEVLFQDYILLMITQSKANNHGN